jgi:hypothetical protein
MHRQEPQGPHRTRLRRYGNLLAQSMPLLTLIFLDSSMTNAAELMAMVTCPKTQTFQNNNTHAHTHCFHGRDSTVCPFSTERSASWAWSTPIFAHTITYCDTDKHTHTSVLHRRAQKQCSQFDVVRFLSEQFTAGTYSPSRTRVTSKFIPACIPRYALQGTLLGWPRVLWYE